VGGSSSLCVYGPRVNGKQELHSTQLIELDGARRYDSGDLEPVHINGL